MLNYILELPINFKDAKRRRLRKDISKLIVKEEGQDDKDTKFVKLGKLIHAFKKTNEIFYAMPISSFSQLGKCKDLLTEKGITCWLDVEFTEQRSKKPKTLIIKCDTEEKYFHLFKIIDAEAIVFYSAKSNDRDTMLDIKLMSASSYGYNEKSYLEQIDKYNFFIFFSESHMSLEVLGFEEPILTCFIKALELEGRHP